MISYCRFCAVDSMFIYHGYFNVDHNDGFDGKSTLFQCQLAIWEVSYGVNSASSDDFRMMQKTIERLSDTVEQLQLEVRRQRREDQDLRRRNSPDQRYIQRSSTESRPRDHQTLPHSRGTQ